LLGNQIAAKWLSLLGITYDPKGELMEIALEGFDHVIHKPRGISVDGGPEGVTAMEIIDSGERRQIVRFIEPLMLRDRNN
jgi:hypothetical protein